jgi:hypothetical protein
MGKRITNNGDIYSTGAIFTVICKRCGKTFEVVRNFGGGIRREYEGGWQRGSNPAECDCGSRQLELY